MAATELANTIADALAANLNAQTWQGGTITALGAVRDYLGEVDLDDLDDLAVTILHAPEERRPVTRGQNQKTIALGVVIQKKIDPADQPTIDALANLTAEIADHLDRLDLATTPPAAWIETRRPVPFEVDELRNVALWSAAIVQTYRVHTAA